MPRGVYTKTEEHKKNLSLALMGREITEEAREKISMAKKGVRLSEEHKRNIGQSRIGTFLSEETRQKISRAHLGKAVSDETKRKLSLAYKKPQWGQDNPMWGRKHTNETKKKMSLAHQGEKSYRWRGGVTPEKVLKYSRSAWRTLARRIRARDGYICQICGFEDRTGRKLEVHHLTPYRVSQDDSESNLLTVCKLCHPRLDIKFQQEENCASPHTR